MQNVKDLYHSRHYTQCAKFAEQLLAMTNEKQIHPIHLTYLHFYTALSHDTLAREATLKNRHKELTLAEKHYLAAIAALKPLPIPGRAEEEDQNNAPDSPTFRHSQHWKRHSSSTGSFDSTASAASSATSYGYGRDDEDKYDAHKSGESFHFPRPPSAQDDLSSGSKAGDQHNTIYISSYAPSSPVSYTTYEYQDDNDNNNTSIPTPNPLASQTSTFLTLLNAHLTSVRTLKKQTSVQTVRFAFPSPNPSSSSSSLLPPPPPPTTSALRDKTRASMAMDGADADRVRQMRRNRVFRQRFDPEGVRRLCGDVLAELA